MNRRRWWTGPNGRLLTVLGSVVLMAVAVFFLTRSSNLQDDAASAQHQQHVAEAQKATAERKAVTGVQLGQRLAVLCQSGSDTAAALRRYGVCVKANQVLSPNPPRLAVDERIAGQVARYLAANPPPGGRPPSDQEILTAVGKVYRQHPPTPGKTPSTAELTDIVVAFCARDSDPCRGATGLPGANGTNGSSVVMSPIEGGASLQQFSGAGAPVGDPVIIRDGPRGPAGPGGPQGTGVTRMDLRGNPNGHCQLVVTYLDPNSGATRQQAIDVNPQVCPPPAAHGEGGG